MKRILPMIFALITLLSACGMNPPPGGTVPPSSGVSPSPVWSEAPVQSGEPQSGGDIDIPDTPYSYLAFENDWLTLRDAYTQAMEPYSVWHECNFDEGTTLLIEPKETLTGLSLYTMDMDSDGLYVRGETFYTLDELTPEVIRRAFFPEAAEKGGYAIDANIPPRPPVLCAGCTHRGFFYEVGKYKDIVVTGDIGCYTLGMVPPLSVTDSVICMGAGVSAGIGFRKAVEIAGRMEKVFAVIGDSTFFHSGITGLIDAIVNKAPIVINILDNRITAMTGHQENPGTGRTLMGEPTHQVDLRALCVACGVKEENVRLIDPYDLAATRAAVKAGYKATEPFVIITTSPCALIKEVIKKRANMKCVVDEEKCVKCKLCLKAGCPAVNFRGGRVYIDRASCNGCTVCMQICPKKAISREGE